MHPAAVLLTVARNLTTAKLPTDSRNLTTAKLLTDSRNLTAAMLLTVSGNLTEGIEASSVPGTYLKAVVAEDFSRSLNVLRRVANDAEAKGEAMLPTVCGNLTAAMLLTVSGSLAWYSRRERQRGRLEWAPLAPRCFRRDSHRLSAPC